MRKYATEAIAVSTGERHGQPHEVVAAEAAFEGVRRGGRSRRAGGRFLAFEKSGRDE